jgi:hypothetical protein
MVTTTLSHISMFLAVFKLVNNVGFSFENSSRLNGVGSQMSVGDRFGNLLHNGCRGSDHGGVVNHRGGSGHIGSGNIRSVSGSGNQRSRSSLNFNLDRFSSLDSHRGSWGGNIGVVGIRITVSAVSVVVSPVVEPIVIVVVRVVTVVSVVIVSVVISSLCLSFCLRVSLTFGQTSLLQGTDSASVSGNAIVRGEGTGSNGYTSGGSSGDCVGSKYGCSRGSGNWNWVVNNGGETGKGCGGSDVWKSSVAIDIRQSTIGKDLRISLSLTFVETVNMSVAVSWKSITVGGTGIKSIVVTIVGTITISQMVRVAIVGTIEKSWVGFRLSLSNSGKGNSENSDLEIRQKS